LVLAERVCWIVGLLGLIVWGAFQVETTIRTRHDLERFAALQVVAPHGGTLDQSTWSSARVSAWHEALGDPAPQPLAVLRIPKIRLEVPVLPGTDEHTLDRAVGHIDETAAPGTVGNSGIAGHRDGFFRGLKDIATGDVIELDTLRGTGVYHVERTWVVDPEDVSVLDATSTQTVTLVTCYYVGAAPRRFIVRGVFAGDSSRSTEGVVFPLRLDARPDGLAFSR